ncbi:MAG: hypothetical protein P4L59_00685 [Desulfosporosinus sp.]|nr:hypothetical protein [Desulfosporosinus sp.]
MNDVMQILKPADMIAIILSFASLVIASSAFYFSILKRGRIKVRVFTHQDDISFNVGSRLEQIPTTIYITLPVVIKNLGANSTAIDQLSWDLQFPDILEAKVFDQPRFGDLNGFCVLKPYEQQIGVTQISVEISGYGKGFSPAFKELTRNVPVDIKTRKFHLLVKYREYTRTRIHQRCLSFDLKPIIIKSYTTE